MRSIRRSLTLYFLGLLGLGLGAAAVFTDRVVGRTLDARQHAATALIDAGFEERCREAREKLDADLLKEAQDLYSGVLLQYTTARFEQDRKFRSSLVGTEVLFVSAPLGRALWAVGTGRGPFIPLAARAYYEHLSLDDAQTAAELGGATSGRSELRQINVVGRSAVTWRSKAMGGLSFPINDPPLDPDKVFDLGYDSRPADGATVRRLVFKAPLVVPPGGRFGPRPPGPPRGRDGPGGRDGGLPQLPPDRVADAWPRVVIQCARQIAVLDAEYAVFAGDRNRQLVELDDSIRSDRSQLRFWLAGIGLATFLAIVLGGPALIRRGLRPLRNLSDAVSRVSEKDFRLPVEQAAMSRELLPIHARLTDTLDELRRAFEREKQAVADISHELRTPVAGLLATIDVTLRRPRSAEQYRTALEESRAIGRQLAGLVERVMTLATLDAGADRVTMTESDVAEVAAGCAAVVRPLAVANGLTFASDLPGPVFVTTDPDKVREVVTNLLHNGVEYNQPGGSIRLTARGTESGGAEIEVADTGIGMPPDVRDRIFERFYRADASRHAAGAHAGLGLSIVREYMNRLGGTIAVESEPGVGSTFRVTLPGTAGPKDRPAVVERAAVGV